MTKPPQLTHELVNDVPVLMHFLREVLALDRRLDAIWPRHGNWQGLSPGQVLVTWLTHILSEGDHRMNQVQDWANTLPHTLRSLLGQPVRATDLSDDRLAEVVRHLSLPAIWHPLEQAVTQQIVRVYRLKLERVRLDTTSVSVYADRDEVNVLFQRGHSKDHRPDLRQFKVMLAALDPLGVVIAADVVAGQRADDGLYLPTILRLQTTLGESGLLYIGDAKMGALATRAYLQATGNQYLVPLAQVGQLPEQMAAWVRAATAGRVTLSPVGAAVGRVRLGEGYEVRRPQVGQRPDGRPLHWTERVLLVRSDAFARAARRGLHQRLKRARAEVLALTPPRGRGHKQFTDAAALRTAAEAILEQREVVGLLRIQVKAEVERQTVRAYAGQPARTQQRQRYLVTVQDAPARIAAQEQRLGWRAYATNVPERSLSLSQAVQAYREEWLVERDCARLKGRALSLRPVWVSREDHAVGLTHLLTLGARVLAVVEYQARLKLQQAGRPLTGLYAGQPKRATDQPTTERLLTAFDRIILTTIQTGRRVQRFLTPLSGLQQTILRHLDCPRNLYSQLVPNSSMPLRI
jgi:transposase